MSPEQHLQAHAKRYEDTIQELDETIRLLKWQMSKIEVRIRRALEWMNKVRLSTP
jgi:hypothetical protein